MWVATDEVEEEAAMSESVVYAEKISSASEKMLCEVGEQRPLIM